MNQVQRTLHGLLLKEWDEAVVAGNLENTAYGFCYWLVRHSGYELRHPSTHYGVDVPGSVRVPIDWRTKDPRRDHFAAAALQGLLASGDYDLTGANSELPGAERIASLTLQLAADLAVECADALIAELDRGGK